MKNKLSIEEQLLQSKLNEAQFAYQEADWKQIESSVAKKGFLSNYNPFLKAAAAFIVLAGAVYLINSKYEQPNVSSPKASNVEKVHTKGETIVKEETESVDKAPEENSSIVVNSDNSSKQTVASTNSPSKATVQSAENSEDEFNSEKKDTPNESKQKESILDDKKGVRKTIEIKGINILNAPCLGENLTVDLDIRGHYQDDMMVVWKLNGKKQNASEFKIVIPITEVGNQKISAEVFRDGNSLAKSASSFSVENKVELDFSYKNLSTPFNDNKVELSINQPVKGKYVWYENRATDKLIAGTKVEMSFKNEGRHNVTVEYTSDLGCYQKKTKSVDMDLFFKPEVFPNAFTPYNGNINEVFELNVLKQFSFKNYELIIEDMNGNKVFNSIDINEGWNGQLNNTGQMLEGVFAWVVKVEGDKGEKNIFNGKVRIR